MNTGAITCLIFAGLFLLLAIIFALLREKGAMLISGFNTMPKEERAKYDQRKMSSDMKKSFLIWSAIFTVGIILCIIISSYFAVVSFIAWLVLFFKDVHLDTTKAFDKYRF